MSRKRKIKVIKKEYISCLVKPKKKRKKKEKEKERKQRNLLPVSLPHPCLENIAKKKKKNSTSM